MRMEINEEIQVKDSYIIEKILEWGRDNFRFFPWRENITPYRILVAEFLLRRTTASAVNRVYEYFIIKYPTLMSLASADRHELENTLQTLGYHRQRSKMMIETSKFIIDKYKGIIPKEMSALLEIPNIGSYTAGALRSLSFGFKAPMVDSNVERIIHRVFMNSIPSRGRKKIINRIAEALVPDDDHNSFNLALLDFGAKICKYARPKCIECPINTHCDSHTQKHLKNVSQ